VLMLDQLLAERVEGTSHGIAAELGAWRLLFASPGRDRDQLDDGRSPVRLYCELELDLNTGTLQSLAFANEERRDLYRALRSISGIGRASAFAVLDAGELIDTLRAVAGEDAAYFSAVPGLGPKKVGSVIRALGKLYGGHLPQPIDAPVAMLVEAREALMLRGLSAREAEARLEAVWRPGELTSSEAWLALVN